MSTVVTLEPIEYDVTLQESVYVVEIGTTSGAAPTVTMQLVAGETLAADDAISVSTAGQAIIADTTTASGKALVVGFVESNTLVGATATIKIFGRTGVRFAVAPGALDIGKEVFLSITGLVTLTPPVASGTTLTRVGILLNTLPEISLGIETRADIP